MLGQINALESVNCKLNLEVLQSLSLSLSLSFSL